MTKQPLKIIVGKMPLLAVVVCDRRQEGVVVLLGTLAWAYLQTTYSWRLFTALGEELLTPADLSGVTVEMRNARHDRYLSLLAARSLAEPHWAARHQTEEQWRVGP